MMSGGAQESVPSGVGLSDDSAARRAQERALADERDRLALALAAGGLGLWSWDRASKVIGWGDGLAQMFGRDPASMPDSVDAWLEIVHPDDRLAVATAMAAASTGRASTRWSTGWSGRTAPCGGWSAAAR
ncbi:MAG: PAS domain-containing protein [Acidimicrobiales bacterium]